jgi:hypothetical protein
MNDEIGSAVTKLIESCDAITETIEDALSSVILDSDACSSLIADTNASGWHIDTLEIFTASRELCSATNLTVVQFVGTFTLSGDLDEDRAWTPDSISGEFVMVAYPNGSYKFLRINARLDEPEEDADDEGDDFGIDEEDFKAAVLSDLDSVVISLWKEYKSDGRDLSLDLREVVHYVAYGVDKVEVILRSGYKVVLDSDYDLFRSDMLTYNDFLLRRTSANKR